MNRRKEFYTFAVVRCEAAEKSVALCNYAQTAEALNDATLAIEKKVISLERYCSFYIASQKGYDDVLRLFYTLGVEQENCIPCNCVMMTSCLKLKMFHHFKRRADILE